METDTTNYLNLFICLISLLSAHAIMIWISICAFKEEDIKPRIKKKKSKQYSIQKD